jgi:hypothetical protein
LFIIFRSNRKSFDLHWKERKIWASNFPIQPPSYFLIFHLSEEKNKKICYSLFLHLTFWLPSIKVLHHKNPTLYFKNMFYSNYFLM